MNVRYNVVLIYRKSCHIDSRICDVFLFGCCLCGRCSSVRTSSVLSDVVKLLGEHDVLIWGPSAETSWKCGECNKLEQFPG